MAETKYQVKITTRNALDKVSRGQVSVRLLSSSERFAIASRTTLVAMLITLIFVCLGDPKRLAILTLSCGCVVAALAAFDPLTSGSGTELITNFLFKDQSSSLTLIFSRILATGGTYLSGAAGGIFSPSLAIGASAGRFLTMFFGSDYPNLMTLLGMIGFLTGVTRTPFTSFILVLEMTDRHSAIFPMMIASISAHGVSKLLGGESFYEQVKMSYTNVRR